MKAKAFPGSPVVVGYGTVALASQIVGKTPGTEAGCALGIQFDRSVEVLDCPVILAFVEIDISAKQVATGIGWEELDGFLVVFDGMAVFAHAGVESRSLEERDGGAAIEADCMIEILDGFAELVVGAAGGASLAIKTWVCRIEFDGLIDLFDGMVIVARELEAGCSQDERVAFPGFGRWFSNFSVRFARWNAAS